jgi:hypothetical protein
MSELYPKCNGQGTVSMSPWVDGDILYWFDTRTDGFIYPVCGGVGHI